MGYQAIVTKYIGPTNTRGSRVKATAQAGSITLHWDYALNHDKNHAKAAKALANRLGWVGQWHEGGLPQGNGNVYVLTEPAFVVMETRVEELTPQPGDKVELVP